MKRKVKQLFICTKCDAQFQKWSGRCLECGSWGTLQEEVIDERIQEKKKLDSVVPAKVINLGDIESQKLKRIKIGIEEVDRVFGGGIVPGSLILISGEPGIGKSTILAQIADAVSEKGVIYISGEESAAQVKARLVRLNCNTENINFISEINTEKIISAIKKESPSLVIIDSIQTIYSGESPSDIGSVNQIRACTAKFLELAKSGDISVILAGHITKDGQIAGPKTLEHMVDTVIHLESDRAHDYRYLRAKKNRFGSVNEMGIFEMTSSGFKEVLNPSQIFLEEKNEILPGSITSCVMEGTRPFLVEVQALVTKTVFGYPQRKASGFDLNRLQVLTAVLTKRVGLNLINQDVILNIVGGAKINDTALDLAVCMAITSAMLNRGMSVDTVVFGEVGLGGEVRRVAKIKERLTEITKLGFKQVIMPDMDLVAKKIKLNKIKKLDNIINLL
ncbi:DNA repair protein RadA [Candidatus Parcubacteria bacterium]|nr:DNA repair protein RadA [Candidatus Parcubacteria bacterium]